jgi:sulfoxide reductase heme-binding subunit YedZ
MEPESPLPQPESRPWLRDHWHRLLAHGAGLFTLAWLALDYAVQGDSYTFNRTVMLRTGSAAIALLAASFACTPVGRLFGWQRPTQVRRALGLYGFLYALLHVWNYAVLENGLDPALIVRDLQERPAMSVGLLALLALVPLAATSTRGWQQRLGKRWRTLHRLVYVAVPFAVWHYLWLDRDIITIPVLYAVLIGALLALRLPVVRHVLRRILPGRR